MNLKLRFPAVWESALVSTEELPFSEETLRACARNACGRYGTSWACPPAVGAFGKEAAFCRSFPLAMVFSTRHDLEDSFDIEGMQLARKEHTRVTDEIAAHYGVPRNRVLGAEACSVCARCSYPLAPCRAPALRRRTVESYAIDVVALCNLAGMKYCNGRNTVTYFSVLLLTEQKEE